MPSSAMEMRIIVLSMMFVIIPRIQALLANELTGSPRAIYVSRSS
jgi:hypothetical protein